MDGRLQSGRRSLRGFYRFTDPEWETQYQARLRRWCFRMALFHLYFDLAVDAVAVVGWLYSGASELPTSFWLTVALDVGILLFLAGLHTSRRCRRHVIPVHCAFILLVFLRNGALIPLQAVQWTDDSYSYLVPAWGTVYVDGPDGRHDLRSVLHDHLATLSAYRATQVAYVNSFAPGIYNMLMGLNPWTVGTVVGMNVLITTGVVSTPFLPVSTKVFNPCTMIALSILSMMFAAAFERMQRRNFGAERLLQWELQASQMADSVLNHSLKNTLADVAGNIEMFLAGALPGKALEDCIVSLWRGIRGCKARHSYLRIAAGEYRPVVNAIPLQDFGRQLLAGRDVVGRFPNCTIYADHTLLTLILDNALSNAVKHGHPQASDVTFTIKDVPAELCPDLQQGKRRFQFQVTNVANPERAALTPEYVQQLFAGCAPRRPDKVAPVLSDRIGLNHCILAAKLGDIALSLSQEEEVVTFSAVLDAEVASDSISQDNCSVATRAPPFPPGLRFVVMDDSLAAQRLLRFHIEKLCAPAAVVCFGATCGDTDAFMAHALMADVVILDQHLDWDEDGCLGTDLVRQLRAALFRGFVCIRSANDGPQDQALYHAAGANCSMGKDLLGPVMLRQLRQGYAQFLASGAAVPAKPAPNGPACHATVADGASSSCHGAEYFPAPATESLSLTFSIHDWRLASVDAPLISV
eukprot:EG_transcript_3492